MKAEYVDDTVHDPLDRPVTYRMPKCPACGIWPTYYEPQCPWCMAELEYEEDEQ